MKWLKWSGRPRPKKAPYSPAEALESRRLFSTGPSLTGEALLGSAQAVTGVVLTFNQPLDPATAQNVSAYGIGRHVDNSSTSNLLGDLGGLFFLKHAGAVARPDAIVLHPAHRGVHGGRVAFTSAIYDNTTMSVTLTPAYPIKATKFFRYVHVSGTGTTAVTNTLGQAIVGNDGGIGTIRVAFKPHQGKSVRYTDASGNRVVLRIKGPGTIVAFLRTGSDPQPIVLLQGTTAEKSTFSASINPAAGNGASTSLQELQGVSNCQTTVTSNPAFSIGLVEP